MVKNLDKKGLKCSVPGCDFKTAATKKAKRQIRKHEEKHREEKTRFSADNTESQTTIMQDSQTSDLLDYNGGGEHVLLG